MTKNKAIEILDNEYDECIKYREVMGADIDDMNDTLIALLTAIDALKEKAGE
jgi:prefoldin subunit 5